MHFIWNLRFPEEYDGPPPPDAACEVGVSAMAAEVGMEIGTEATVYVTDEPLLGTYGIGKLHRPRQAEAVYVVDYDALRRAMSTVADAKFAKSAHPERGTFEHEALRLLRRSFLHWPDEQVNELAAVLPKLRELAWAMAPDTDPFD